MEEGVKARVRRLTRRQKVGIIALILVVFIISCEVYAHNYVQARALPIVTKEQALEQLGAWLNGTYAFSSSGCSWLVTWRINRPQPGFSFAYFLIFKTGQNSTLWIPRTDLAILKPNPTSNNSGYFQVYAINTVSESNDTAIQIEYGLGWIGVYKIDFDICVQVYQETLLSLVPGEVINLPSNFTMYYGP